ncbi:MAG: hypothetical protein ACRDUY_01945, partial [Nitriliruptorales bacterium]
DAADIELLETLAASVPPLAPLAVGDLLGVGPGSDAALETSVNVLDLVASSAFIANGTHALTVPAISLSLGGLTNVTSSLSIVETTRRACRPSEAFTAQTSLDLAGDVVDLPPLLGLLEARASLRLDLDAATALGVITNLLCGTDTKVVDIEVVTALTQLEAAISVTLSAVLLGEIGGITVRLATRDSGATDTAHFEIPPDGYDQLHEVGAGDLGLSGLTPSVTTSGLAESVLAGLGLDLDGITSAVLADIVSPLLLDLDQLLLGPLLDLLGINVAGADVAVLPEVVCGRMRLVG